MILRPYQNEAKSAVYHHLQMREDNPCVVLPTGAGKGPLIASICADVVNLWNGRVIVLSHVREILTQNADKIKQIDSSLTVGIYSAGLGRRDTTQSVIMAGIQSVYKRAHELGRFEIAIVDEAHLLSEESESMYGKFFLDCKIVSPGMRTIGTTATPFRLSSGMLCKPDAILNHVCYEARIKELIRDGYLSRLIARSGTVVADLSGVHVRAGEFIPAEAASAFDTVELVASACKEIVELTKDRKAILIFGSSVDHARHVADEIERLTGEQCGYIVGDTPANERDDILTKFKSGELRFVSNCNVLTTGFDNPRVDAIALLRATLSPGLYAQICGRGFRIAPGKTECVILDYGGNVFRHGCLDNLKIKKPGKGEGEAPVKECPGCHWLIHASYAICPECGFIFPAREPKHGTKASGDGVISGEAKDTECEVSEIRYGLHTKRGTAPGDAPPTLRVDYKTGFHSWSSEWVCIEHSGFAQDKARGWWQRRTRLPFPESVAEAVAIARGGGLSEPSKITLREVAGEKFPKIVKYELPEAFEPGDSFEIDKKETVKLPEEYEFDPFGTKQYASIKDSESLDDEIPF